MDNELKKTENSASIGALLFDAGKITNADAERIISLQKQKGLRFGDAAKSLGLINDDDIQKVLSSQFDYPYLAAGADSFSKELIAAYQPFSVQVEAFRAIRGQLMLRWLNIHKTISLTSPGREEGRSCLAANLAIVFSQLGERTLLIDADLRQPSQHELFKFKSDFGLSDLLVGRTQLENVIKRVEVFKDLSILPAGTIPPNPVELSNRFSKRFLQEIQKEYDVILVDTPAAEQGADAQIITATCEASVLVARQDKTSMHDLEKLKHSIQETGSQCLGVVLVNC